jgi:predicted nuclease of predicted toxin-antitoxin system
MKLLLDMGLSVRTGEFLRDCGLDAVHLGEQGLHRMSDPEIMRKATDEGRVLVTFDLDFPRLLALLRASQPSTIVFRIEAFTTNQLNGQLLHVVQDCAAQLEAGAIVVVESDRIRIRTLPIW